MGSFKLSRCLRRAMAAACLLSASYALDPNRTPSQYSREQWTNEGDFPGGPVHAISQTSDGYLWIGTDTGLLRFDGFNFRPVPLSPLIPAPNTPVLGLLTDVDGSLLIRLQGAGVLRLRNGKFEIVTTGIAPAPSQVTAMWRDESGRVLLADLVGGTRRSLNEKVEQLAKADLLPGSAPIISLASTPDGKVWMGTLNSGVFTLAEGQAVAVAKGLPYTKINCLLAVAANEVWVGTDSGAFRWNGTRFVQVALPLRGSVQVLTLLHDRDANAWVGTARGLVRINSAGASLLEEKDLRGDGGIDALFEDREGNIWVGGARGIERIRNTTFVTHSSATGLPSERNGPVYSDSENRIWFAPLEGGLYFFKDGAPAPIREAGLEKDVIYSIAGQKEEIWVGRQHGGLTRVQYRNGKATSQTYTERDGLAQNSVYAVYQSPDRTVWAGTISGGVSRFKDRSFKKSRSNDSGSNNSRSNDSRSKDSRSNDGGSKDSRFVTYTTASGLSSNTIYSILATRDGTTWFATPNGLSSFSEGHWKTYSSKDGLPSDNVDCLFEDSSGVLWIGTSNGLASLRSGRVRAFPEGPVALQTQILGIAEDKSGWLWVAASNHVLRVRRDKPVDNPLEEGDIREYGTADGLRSNEALQRTSAVVRDSLGRIWFSMTRGLSVIDPSRLSKDSPPAIVHLEAITADGRALSSADSIRIPAAHKRVTLSYTGLSLAVPQRVRFRYFLDGFDRNWSDPTASREAVYTNLNPGPYRFRIIASNSDGLWNGSESSVSFRVDPSFWQTWWFMLLGVLTVGLAILTFLRLRVLSLTRQMNIRFEERVGERTRIARELHDSLLQGFQGLMFRLQVVRDLLPARPAEAMRALEGALDRGDQVIAEGRGTVEDLRSSTLVNNDLVQALSTLGEELALTEDRRASKNFRVLVEGQPRALEPILRDEVYRIAREALRNAFHHSQAQKIEAELTYRDSQFLLRIRDDGKGIDPKYLVHGSRAGHWGLPGMRERAKAFGGHLEIWSQEGAGTEVELTVPASIAYRIYSARSVPARSRFRFFRKKA